ncbi:hypothetical protein BJ878DRAFT_425956 [Calycina marina]|uniref:O-fucosyltransferase family protein n=1 Tax=Calycina marina TaxID=1763456 RepID=A0A9P8CCX2_9HELO|nr:hypothetical protein BJ878DRAFT_425956 [Calycina marina]
MPAAAAPIEQLSEQDAFVHNALQTPIEGPFDRTSISALCAKTKWTEGLIFTCDAPQGGFGNVENVFINCLRYVMEAGGAFVVPQIIARSPDDLSDLHTVNLVDFDYLFDRDHFNSTLAEACPQMKIYNSTSDLKELPLAADPIVLDPGSLSAGRLFEYIITEPAQWRASFDTFLQSKAPAGISSTSPVLVQIQALLQIPVSYDTPAFVHNFGRIFRFREDVRKLAANALFHLTSKLSSATAADERFYQFFGAHLRVASDAAKAGWPGYDAQGTPYLAQAVQHNLSIIYLATGSVSDIARFRLDAAKQNCTVFTKTDLLSGEDLEALDRLSWDQQALVDMELLLRGSQFGGIEESSFAWKIAARRHLLSKSAEYTVTTRGREDELSVVYGKRLWPVFPLAMWP